MSKKRTENDSDFKPDTKHIIAGRAGFRCSYPDCNRLLIGPGTESDKLTNLGDCGHIFAASPIGPRTDGGLTPEQLKSPQNGIFLCKHHHGLVDRRFSDNEHTSDMLLRYKDRHEFRISGEIGEYQYPLNWINSFKLVKSTLFKNPLEILLGKVTFLFGENNSGKSLIVDVLYAALTQELEPRLNRRDFSATCQIEFDNPVLSKIKVEMDHTGEVRYEAKNLNEAFLPYPIRVLFLRNELEMQKDHIGEIADCLRLSRAFLLTHIRNLELSDSLYAEGIRVVPGRRKPYLIDELTVRTASSKDFYMPFGSLSSSEQFLTVVDILIALANSLAAFQTVFLLIDWADLFHLDKKNMSRVMEHLRSKSSRFQSLVVSPHPYPHIDWTGWGIANLHNEVPHTLVKQDSLR